MALPAAEFLQAYAHRFVRPILSENVYSARPAFARARRNQQKYHGGLEADFPIQYQHMPNVAAFAGGDLIPMALANTENYAKYQMKRYFGQLLLLTHDILRNGGGAEAVMKLTTVRRKELELEFQDVMGTDAIQGTGTGSTQAQKAFEGLLNIADNITASGGISPGDFPGWAAKVLSGGTVAANMLPFIQLFGATTIGSSQVTVFYTTQNIMNQMLLLSMNAQRFVDSNTADLGFAYLGFNGRPIIVDSGMPESGVVGSSVNPYQGSVLALNEQFIWLYTHQADDFSTVYIPHLPDQDGSVYRVTYSGFFGSDNRRMQGKNLSVGVA